MNTVDRIIKICKDRQLPISRLERACDFSNGYIKALTRGTMPADKLERVAKYLGVSIVYLMTGNEGYYLDPDAAEMAQAMFDDPDMRILFNAKREMSPKKFHKIIDIITAFRDMENADDGDI